jgi:glycerophosphoryl diester phosphodiesterase
LNPLTIVAHRGITDRAPENTLGAFRRAIELGADAVEMDVRLTADSVPVVYHYAYLQHLTAVAGPVFGLPLEKIREVRFADDPSGAAIPMLEEVLSEIGGRIGLEIELKGPELEAPQRVAELLNRHRTIWDSIEVTSFEPGLLLALREACPGIAVDLLLPKSEEWMGLDVVAFYAANRGRMARARAVHLHPTQLEGEVVAAVRRAGMEVHAWDVNEKATFEKTRKLGIPNICTDRFEFIAGLAGRKISEGVDAT